MKTQTRAVFHCLSILILTVQVSQPVCVDVTPETEAVLGSTMKLSCIACMKREEINAETEVHWHYITKDRSKNITIFRYRGTPEAVGEIWKDRLTWNGSKDLQDVSISIKNVTLNDTGTYECLVFRKFFYDSYTPSFVENRTINLVVLEKAGDDKTAFYSEIMMYVLLVFLTFWLLVEMIYCYRKISKSDEQAQDNTTDYLVIPSENKENPGPPVTE
ncbi:sodium channel regulatory subunit beta-3 [Chanos chanos]|uniref:Sodium channel regulatory subunit beta-3 n=1 Tax=Chanos chanos TaxID=29144 RepID=A0A6J2VR14_CHACN|nr:sodium channel subunit beta-3 [Chanos chanos]